MITWEELRGILIPLIPNGKEIDVMPDTYLFGDLEFDSLSIMELLLALEDEYGIDFTSLDNFAMRFERCDLLLEGINELLKNKREV